jgi:hypothetical protein
MRTIPAPSAVLTALALSVASFAGIASLAACGGGDTPPASSAQSLAAQQAAMDKSGEPALPTKPDSDKVTWKQDPSYAKCHNDVKTGADLVAGVTALGQACASTMGLKPLGPVTQDTYKNMDPAHVLPLHVDAGHCVRVYGLSEDALQDLDIAITDSAGNSAGEDGSDSPDAVVLESGMICFTVADDVKVNVAAGNGAGKYAVQIWGN